MVDAFTKFTWIYPTKTLNSDEVIQKLNIQKKTFGNPTRIISDKGSAFTSAAFEKYCKNENILHVTITAGVSRANGQVERLNRVILSIMSKLCFEEPEKWYKSVDQIQTSINSVNNRSIGTSPFELLIGTKMKLPENEALQFKTMIETEMISLFNEDRDFKHQEAKIQIKKVQEENRKIYNLRRRKATKYKEDDIVAIKRTQFKTGKIYPKYLGPYQIIKVVQVKDLYNRILQLII